MPKIVDHEQRRAELGAAVRRVVARSGVGGATVRAVATESGWSMGALRYYFATQSEMLDFAVSAMLDDIPARMQIVLETQEPGIERAQAVLEEMLPLDEDRLAEVRVYLAFMARVRTEDGRPGLAQQTWHGERHVCGLAIADVTGLDHPTQVGVIPAALVSAVDELQVFVDGLSFLGATLPAQLTPSKSRALLRARLDSLAR
ncbi:TetR family transcriptional regulator C-terminal domain-containing protein [Knoellia sp. S7-12]|uniref:TetR/AcrR family transcriptional regulator n=1 Tax=Knoellia sp. S7-12 TaxID=3126698 RepID=UPI0033699EF4